jgi:hypothetical protein
MWTGHPAVQETFSRRDDSQRRDTLHCHLSLLRSETGSFLSTLHAQQRLSHAVRLGYKCSGRSKVPFFLKLPRKPATNRYACHGSADPFVQRRLPGNDNKSLLGLNDRETAAH